MKQFTSEEAVKIYESGSWKSLNELQKAGFQLYNEFLFMPFSDFQLAIENVLGHPIFTHEFANSEILKNEWESIHNIPEFPHMKELLLPR